MAGPAQGGRGHGRTKLQSRVWGGIPDGQVKVLAHTEAGNQYKQVHQGSDHL